MRERRLCPFRRLWESGDELSAVGGGLAWYKFGVRFGFCKTPSAAKAIVGGGLVGEPIRTGLPSRDCKRVGLPSLLPPKLPATNRESGAAAKK